MHHLVSIERGRAVLQPMEDSPFPTSITFQHRELKQNRPHLKITMTSLCKGSMPVSRSCPICVIFPTTDHKTHTYFDRVDLKRVQQIFSELHKTAFEAIKKTVVSRECLTTIDFTLMLEHRIFVMTDANDYQSGVVFSFGESWETAHPVAFDSMMFKGVELNYPVHEKEMLAIIRALQRWCSDLIGVPFMVYTDHKTLENFDCQCDLSQRQSRWMEFMSQYDCKIVYVKGEENCAADALSQTSFKAEELASIPYLPDNHRWHLWPRSREALKAHFWESGK